MLQLRYIVAFIMVSCLYPWQPNAENMTITGHGNVQVKGKNNTVDNNARISNSPITIHPVSQGYSNPQAEEDLRSGNYNSILFEKKKSERKAQKTVLILTGTNFETGVIHEAAEKAGLKVNKTLVQDHIVYHMGALGGVNIIHMQPGMMGTSEPGATPLILMSVFRDLQPDYMISTGIAFGRKSKGQNLGEICVSRQLVNYESRKELDGSIIFRGDKVTSPMLERVNAGVHSWKGVKIHQGVVLSGNALVNSKTFLEHLEKREPEYVGGDMESYGAYAVASMMSSKWVMIKGISDWGDGTKNDNHHRIALENVSGFIFHLITDGNLR